MTIMFSIDYIKRRMILLLAVFFVIGVTSDNAIENGIEYTPYGTLNTPPAYLQTCHKNDKQFNQCVKTSLQTLLQNIVHGSNELGLPSIDPLHVSHLDINEGIGEDVYLKLNFDNISFFGLSNVKIMAVRSNLQDYKFEVTLKYPYLNMGGIYKGDGGIKDLPLVGNGVFSFNMTDVSAAWIIYMKEPELLDHNLHFTIDQFLIDLIPGEISAKFGGEVDGDESLGLAVNEFFNENSQEFFKMAKLKIMAGLSNVFVNISNHILNLYPAHTLLPS